MSWSRWNWLLKMRQCLGHSVLFFVPALSFVWHTERWRHIFKWHSIIIIRRVSAVFGFVLEAIVCWFMMCRQMPCSISVIVGHTIILAPSLPCRTFKSSVYHWILLLSRRVTVTYRTLRNSNSAWQASSSSAFDVLYSVLCYSLNLCLLFRLIPFQSLFVVLWLLKMPYSTWLLPKLL